MSGQHCFKADPTGLTGSTKFTGMLIPTGRDDFFAQLQLFLLLRDEDRLYDYK